MGERVPLISSAYMQDNLLFQAQRQINLYVEDQDEKSQQTVPAILYQTPGLTQIAPVPNGDFRYNPVTFGAGSGGILPGYGPGVCRGAYAATNGDVYIVVGQLVFYIDSSFTYHPIGIIQTGSGFVSMTDNGQAVLLVDGSANYYAINMLSVGRPFAVGTDTNYLASDHVDYLDSFFICHPVGSSILRLNYFLSLGNVTFTQLTGGTTLTNIGNAF